MRARIFPIVLIVLSLATWARANPVPDHVAMEFRNLVAETSQTGTCSDPERLTQHFGSFGLDLLDDEHLQGMADCFDAFADLLAAAQAPEHRPHYAIHRFYRQHADADQRMVMIHSLRRWLTEDIQQAPLEGTGRVTGPPEAVREIIDRVRVTAAEMLADWQDQDAADLMDAVKPECRTDDNCWNVLHWSRQRLQDPCAGRVLDPVDTDSLTFCVSVEDLQSAVAPDTRPYRLTADERARLWELLARAQLDKNSNWAGGPRHIELAFSDGRRVDLSPTEPGRMTWHDNTSLDRRRRLTIRSAELYEFIKGLPEQGACGHEPLSLEYASWYYDGGTVGVVLTDDDGCRIEFCFDHRLSQKRQGQMYVGARCPTCPGARRANNREAKELVALAQRILDARYPPIVQAELLKKPTQKQVAHTEQQAWLVLRELENGIY